MVRGELLLFTTWLRANRLFAIKFYCRLDIFITRLMHDRGTAIEK